MQRYTSLYKWTGLAMILLMLLFSCKNEKGKSVGNSAEIKQTYTCPMHPQIVQNKMGTCPICGMDLVPFDKSNKDAFLTLNKEQQLLANVTVMPVGDGNFTDVTRLNGRLVINPEQTSYISSRVAGRIEKIFAKETGIPVKKGQPLYTIYSEQLLALQQEYIVAAAQADEFPGDTRFAKIADAAARKLILYDQSLPGIETLRRTKKTNPYITYPAPAGGMVAELSITEGQYVAEGGPVLKLENYNQLWVEADVYPGEASLIRQGQHLAVIIPGSEQEPQVMTVQFIQPALSAGTQLMQIRGTITNKNNRWQPGLQALVLLPRKVSSKALMLPASAVIRDGKSTHVWVAVTHEKFEPREVELGMENAGYVEIVNGLEKNEKVVVTGAYLLSSEYILKKGAHPVAHSH